MIASKLFLVSDETSVHLDNKDILSINLLEDVVDSELPVEIDSVIIVGFLTKDDLDPDHVLLKLTILNNNVMVKKQSIRTDFKGKNIYGLIIHARGIYLHEEGTVDFVLYDEADEEIARYSMQVHVGEPENTVETPAPSM